MGSVLLQELVDIRMGHSFRAGLEADPSGTVAVIQMKDLGEDHLVGLTSLLRVTMDIRQSQLVREGDIVIRSRGDRSTCAIVAADPGCAVVAAPLLRLRVADRRLVPAYLNWFINQPLAQGHLAKHAEGSYVKMISKTALENLEVYMPPLERQRTVVKLAALSVRQRILSADIEDLRSRLSSDIMMTYAQGGTAE